MTDRQLRLLVAGVRSSLKNRPIELSIIDATKSVRIRHASDSSSLTTRPISVKTDNDDVLIWGHMERYAVLPRYQPSTVHRMHLHMHNTRFYSCRIPPPPLDAQRRIYVNLNDVCRPLRARNCGMKLTGGRCNFPPIASVSVRVRARECLRVSHTDLRWARRRNACCCWSWYGREPENHLCIWCDGSHTATHLARRIIITDFDTFLYIAAAVLSVLSRDPNIGHCKKVEVTRRCNFDVPQ